MGEGFDRLCELGGYGTVRCDLDTGICSYMSVTRNPAHCAADTYEYVLLEDNCLPEKHC